MRVAPVVRNVPSKVEGWKDVTYGDEIREHLLEFADEGWEAIPEDEHDAWFDPPLVLARRFK